MFARPLIEGRWFGTMCLSEPQAGSSLADITTRAVSDGADAVLGPRYRLFGNKMWISGGDHDMVDNIVHLVLAKVPGDDGRIAPGMSGNLAVRRAETAAGGEWRAWRAQRHHRDGPQSQDGLPRHHRIACSHFGEGTRHRPDGDAGAVGFRVGDVGQGLAIMFQMMNEARIAVGVGAAALACRGYHHSLAYARERAAGTPLRPGAAGTPSYRRYRSSSMPMFGACC